jgi:hypothetical protein
MGLKHAGHNFYRLRKSLALFVPMLVLMQCTWGQSIRISSIERTIPVGTKQARDRLSAQSCRFHIAFSANHTIAFTEAVYFLQQNAPEGAIGFADIEVEQSEDWWGRSCIRIEGNPVFPSR